MIKLIVFDLDDTLFDSTSTVGKQGYILAAKAMVGAGIPATWQKVHYLFLTLMKKIGPYATKANREICHAFGITDEAAIERICAGAEEAYDLAPVKDIKLFPGTRPLLTRLKRLHTLVLVSTGKEKRQQEKIRKLNIGKFFDFICVTDGKSRTKSSCLRQVLEMYHFSPRQVCVVGDRIDSEIRYANELGMISIRVRHGKYKTLQPQGPLERPMYTISRITELERVLEKIDA